MKKDSIIRHSPANGHLSKYQESITDTFLKSILKFEKEVQKISQDCNLQLSRLFRDYKNLENENKAKLDAVLGSMSTSQVPFEELSQEVSETGERLIVESSSLYTKSLEIYEESFSKIRPEIEKMQEECKNIIPQIEPHYHDMMETKIQALNESFLKNKAKIIQLLEDFTLNARKIKKDSEEEFLRRTDDWRTNRFENIFNDAKNQLNPFQQLEYGTIFEEFCTEQAKFTRCFQKSLQSFTIIFPPEHFGVKEVTEWWDHVDEILTLHSNFISIYIGKISNHLSEKTVKSSKLLQEVQTELSTLKSAAEVSTAINELIPLQRHSQKLNQVFIEKLSKYFEYNKTNLRKAFESLRDFMLPLAETYTKYISDTEESFKNIKDRIDTEKAHSDGELAKLEASLAEKEGEIAFLANEKDINLRVSQCQVILQNIEKEYRVLYEKTVAILDEVPEKIKGLFDPSEIQLLNMLKLRKTVFAPEFANIIKPTNGRARAQTIKKTFIRPKKGPRLSKAQQADLFAFTVSNGAKFEETETLKIIPEFEEYTDESTTTLSNKKGKGKAGQRKSIKLNKSPAKSKNKKGSIEDSFDDFDIPEFNFVSSIPKVNDKLAIEIYIPNNTELLPWSKEFRKQIIGSINSIFGEFVVKSQYKEERNILAVQLNERMRTHAPRLNALDLNIAKTRVLQIESRKMQLEKHFHHVSATFNKGISVIVNDIDTYKKKIFDEINQLSPFLQKIYEIHDVSHFIILEQSFKFTEKHFLTDYEDAKKQLNDEIESFIKSFKQTNDRFIDTVVKQDESYSKEESDVTMEYFNKMKVQITDLITQLKDKIVQESIEIDNRYQSIADEFQIQMPKNISDVKFIEALAAQQNQAKTKYDTLVFRNKQQEVDIEVLLQGLEEVMKSQADPQQFIIAEFEALERLRIALIKRAKYLNILKSEVSYDPIGFNIDLSSTLFSTDHDSSLQSPSEKKKTKTRMKSLPNKAKLNLLQKKSSEQDVLGTMQGQVESIGNNLIAAATKIVTDYFANLKTTKSTISRTNEIPANPNDNIQNVKNIWNEQIGDTPQILENSGIKFRSQISKSIALTREATTLIYKKFSEYYLEQSVAFHSKSQEELKVKLNENKIQREINKKMLSPRISDPNNIGSLNDLVRRELKREKEEKDDINIFETTVIEGERSIMNQFTTHIPMITLSLMSLFDKFPLFEDLADGPIDIKERKSYKALLKTKERKASTLPEDQDRPFHVKQWPTLPYVMEPMNAFAAPTPEPVATTTTKSSQSRKKKDKKRESLKPVEVESMPMMTTIDTQLHRGVIVERNSAFDKYQEQLKNRITEFQKNVESKRNETVDFDNYWRTAVTSLCPKYVFPVIK